MTRAGQMRRQARRLSRYGFQPMMMHTTDDRFPETPAVLAFRWAWRYRSELGPLFIAGLTMAVAAVLHATRHGGWLAFIIAATAVAVAGLAAFGRRLGMTSSAERLYAAVVAAAAGGWRQSQAQCERRYRKPWPLPAVCWLSRGELVTGDAPVSVSSASSKPGRSSPNRSAWPDHASCRPW